MPSARFHCKQEEMQSEYHVLPNMGLFGDTQTCIVFPKGFCCNVFDAFII